MIRINLLKAQTAPSTVQSDGGGDGNVAELSVFDRSQVQRKAFINLAFILLTPIALYVYEFQVLPEKRRQANQYSQQLAEIASYNSKNEAAVNEIKKFESDRDRIQKQISFLEKLSQQRVKEIMILDLLQQIIPEKTWLSKISITATDISPSGAGTEPAEKTIKMLSINGRSLADSEVLDFTEKLQKSALLENVVPRKTVDIQLDKNTVKEFLIDGKLVNK